MKTTHSARRAGSGHARTLKMAPVAVAVRHVLAASVAALALAGPAVAFAEAPAVPVAMRAMRSSAAPTAVHDLTVVAMHVPAAAASAVVPPSQPGDTVVDNSAAIATTCNTDCIVLGGTATNANTHITNSGALTADSSDANNPVVLTGIGGAATGGGVAITNSGAITLGSTSTARDGWGIQATGDFAGVYNTGDIAVTASGSAIGIGVNAPGDVVVTNSGTLDLHGTTGPSKYGPTAGIAVFGGDGSTFVVNRGDITVNGTGNGILASSDGGAVDVDNGAAITVAGGKYATGISVASNTGDVTVANSSTITVDSTTSATGISVITGGSADLYNAGDIIVSATGNNLPAPQLAALGPASLTAGIYQSAAGDAYVTNTGDITVAVTYGDAAGISANAGGHLVVDNSGALDVTSTYGTADGIFAYATVVDVTNSGAVSATGGTWAAGIEAQATDGVSVQNIGTISAQATDGPAFGIYATGGTAFVANAGAIDVTVAGYATGTGVFASAGVGGAAVTNLADITVVGGYSNGIDVTSTGTADLYNDGTLNVGDGSTLVSTGIHVSTGYDAGNITIVNAGDIYSSAVYVATGIDAVATGTGSTVDITNVGTVFALTDSPFFTTTGIVGSGDADTTVQNGGLVVAYGNGTVDGIVATSATGTAALLNAGAAYAVSNGSGTYYATALAASSTGGDASIDNLGFAAAYSNYVSISALANGRTGAVVTNDGQLVSQATYAYGAIARSGEGDARIVNNADGVIQVEGAWAMGLLGQATQGDVLLDNAGQVQTRATDITSTGVRGISTYGNVAFDNSGDVTAIGLGTNGAVGAALSSAQGNVAVDNTGTTQALAYYNATALRGIATAGDVDVSNAGTAYALSIYGNAVAVGLTAGGAIDLDNAGLLNAVSYYGNAIGANAVATGGLSIDNTGSVFVNADATAIAVAGRGGTVAVTNAGDISAAAVQSAAYGLYLQATAGNLSLSNTGAITVAGPYAAGAFVSGAGDVSTQNAGTIAALGDIASFGILSQSQGNGSVSNTGTLRSQSAADAFGIRAVSNGTLAIGNSGTLIVDGADSATAIDALGGLATSVTANGGRIGATSSAGDATGIHATSYAGLTVSNAAGIDATAHATALGIDVATYAGALVTNTGSINATSSAGSAAAISGAADGTLGIDNAGTLTTTAYDVADGIAVLTNGDAAILNRGTITATSTGGMAVGIDAGAYGALAVENRSTINAHGDAAAIGVSIANGPGAASLLNTGTISATADGNRAVGAEAGGIGNVVIDNRGLVTAINDTSAIAVQFDTAGTLYNSGTLRPQGAGDVIAVFGDAGVQDIRNSGRIEGAIITGAGDDRLLNGNGGIWTITDGASDFGSGNDVVTNASGGTFAFDGGAIAFGSGDDVLTNAVGGLMLLNDGSIDFGGSTTGNAFNNAGTVRVTGAGLIDMGSTGSATNAKAFVNTGALDLANGSFDDVLTIKGDLGGNGHLIVDADLDGAGADHLVVQGNVASGAVQTVDMHVTGVPTVDMQPVEFARVTGTSTANSFVAGQVTGFSPADFLDLRVNVQSSISTANTTPDIFYVGLDVAGLNSAGVLGATVAAGAHSLMASSTGTWRERMGIDPSRDGGLVGLGPWIRVFGDHGRVAPSNQGGSMGSAGDLRFDQSNHGTEVGFDAHVGRGIHAGVLVGKADGTQRLVNGAGTNRLRGEHSGVYGSWFGADGSYVDVSYRWSNFDARLTSAGVVQTTRGDGHAVNVEAGLGGLGFGNVHVVPQLQYTRSTVDNIDAIVGSTATFQADGGSSTRGRVGVEFNTVLRSGAVTWTPYGALSAVREFDGETRYAIDSFTGTTSTKGTSAKIDLGVGMQYRGISITGGANWTDGGALQDFVGGQVILRYTW